MFAGLSRRWRPGLRFRPSRLGSGQRNALWPDLRESFARDVRAAAPVSVVSGDVSAAIDHPAHGLDAELGVADGAVVTELRGWAVDVEAVSSSGNRHVAAEDAAPVKRSDHERVAAAASDHVPADSIVRGAQAGSLESDPDAVEAGADNDVAGDQVAAPRSTMTPPSSRRLRLSALTFRCPRTHTHGPPRAHRLPRT